MISIRNHTARTDTIAHICVFRSKWCVRNRLSIWMCVTWRWWRTRITTVTPRRWRRRCAGRDPRFRSTSENSCTRTCPRSPPRRWLHHGCPLHRHSLRAPLNMNIYYYFRLKRSVNIRLCEHLVTSDTLQWTLAALKIKLLFKSWMRAKSASFVITEAVSHFSFRSTGTFDNTQ